MEQFFRNRKLQISKKLVLQFSLFFIYCSISYSWVHSDIHKAVNLSGVTQNVMIIMLYWSEQVSQNYTYLLANKRSTNPVKFMTSRETQEFQIKHQIFKNFDRRKFKISKKKCKNNHLKPPCYHENGNFWQQIYFSLLGQCYWCVSSSYLMKSANNRPQCTTHNAQP